MKDIMVDLETLGNTPGCVILSIGAVAFDPVEGVLSPDGFYNVLNTADCMDHYLSKDEETEKWWGRQSEEARQVLRDAEDAKTSVPLKLGLENFNTFVRQYGGQRTVRVWGNGSDFDNAILAVAFKMAGIKPNWEFWNNRCYRTLKNHCPGPKLERVGTYHNALDDARSQAIHLMDFVEKHPSLVW
jgi:hypothetical protein